MAKIKGKVIFDEDNCKGCSLCIPVCPVDILTLEKTRINKKGYYPAGVVDPDKCIGCAFCAEVCPDLVITVERYR